MARMNTNQNNFKFIICLIAVSLLIFGFNSHLSATAAEEELQSESLSTDLSTSLKIIWVKSPAYLQIISTYSLYNGEQELSTVKTLVDRAAEKGIIAVAATNGGFFGYNDLAGDKDGKTVGATCTYMEGGQRYFPYENTDFCKGRYVFYITQNNEAGVVPYASFNQAAKYAVTGVALLYNGASMKLPANDPEANYETKGKQRNGICLKEDGTVGLFVNTAKTSLADIQQKLKNLGCKHAINIDGGGTSSMYIANPAYYYKTFGEEEAKNRLCSSIKSMSGFKSNSYQGVGCILSVILVTGGGLGGGTQPQAAQSKEGAEPGGAGATVSKQANRETQAIIEIIKLIRRELALKYKPADTGGQLKVPGGAEPTASTLGPMNVVDATAENGVYCHYCGEMKEDMKKMYPGTTCLSSCCKAPCPPGSKVIQGLTYFSQHSLDTDKTRSCQPGDRRISKSGCGPTSFKMVLSGHYKLNIEDLFCPGELNIYSPGSVNRQRAEEIAKDLGYDISYSGDKISDFSGLMAKAHLGQPIWYFFEQNGNEGVRKERTYFSDNGHGLVIVGGNNDYAIVYDPAAGGLSMKKEHGQNMVLSKNFITTLGYYYLALNMPAGTTPTAQSGADYTGGGIEGIDVSHYQHNIDWQKVAQSGKKFVFIKATESTDYVDNTFVTNINGATAAGVIAGAYHFAKPSLGARDAEKEAEHFANTIQPYLKGYLRPVLDLESGEYLGKTVLTNWVHNFMRRFKELTGVEPIIYANPNYLNKLDDSVNQYDIWVANWGVEKPSVSGWKFWQYTSKGSVPGISGNVDLDRFNGDVALLKNEFVIGGATA